jgi:MFS family permease
VLGSIGTAVFGFPLFLLVNTGNPVLIVIAYVIGLTVLHESLNGTQGAYFSELFQTNTRSSGASLGYQFSATIAGFVPFIATAIAVWAGWAAGALIYVFVGVIALIGALLTRETWSRADQQRVQDIIDTPSANTATRVQATTQTGPRAN